MKIALENILPDDATERFKFQILMDHLKLEEALLVADSYSSSKYPFSDTMAALNKQYGQPHQLALQRIAELMDGPNIASGDIKAFRLFALQVRSLVGMLEQLGRKGEVELECGSHVSRLLGKLPHDLRSSFRRHIHPHRIPIPTLLDLADWLEYEIQVQEDNTRFTSSSRREPLAKGWDQRREPKPVVRTTTVLLGTETRPPGAQSKAPITKDKVQMYCPYCDNGNHSLNNCTNFKRLTRGQKESWVKEKNGCWRCGRDHHARECNLKMRCKTCNRRHLIVLHEVSERVPERPEKAQGQTEVLLNTTNEVLYVDRPPVGRKVLLKLSKVLLRNGDKTMETFAILDDGSERTILLNAAAQQLGLKGQPEDITLRTVRQELQVLHGAAVSFTISPVAEPRKLYHIQGAFTAKQLGLAKHTQPVSALQQKFRHLKGLPLQHIVEVQPVLLIGSDYPHLITPVEPVRLGPPGGPAAIKTRLGWTLQGPTQELRHSLTEQQCLFTSTLPSSADLYSQIERLWQIDVLPWRSEKASTRSRHDQEAIDLLEARTVRVEVDGVRRYATPLLRAKNMPQLRAPKEAVLSQLRGIEKRLAKAPDQAQAYKAEIQKLEQASYAVKLAPGAEEDTATSWYIPHHMVQHNGKNRIVFNCSFQFRGNNLNELLLPGPTLSPSLLSVLLRFREHSVGISSDIRGMFHQVRLLPEDRPLLRFLWRDMNREEPPSVYEWRVLPFSATSSPCCATFALQKHARDNAHTDDAVGEAIERSFYVDNCMLSLTSEEEAKALVDQLRKFLAEGGFDLRQWASNVPSVIRHLPSDARSDSAERWIAQGQADAQESTLGLHWHCQSDILSYKSRPLACPEVTMRTIYKVLASQYDPLGYIIPYTTRAKMIVQQLWDKKRDWDDPQLPEVLLQSWREWERELPDLQSIALPRCYCSRELDSPTSSRDIHVFCDASERAYGSVAYLRTEDPSGKVEVAFLTARSRVAPRKQQSIPRLELCAALTGAQLAKVLLTELSLPIRQVTFWSDSTTVLTWLQSDSCRFKVFVGTRVAEIQDLTDRDAWRYVDTTSNPADDITRGKALAELGTQSRWYQGPSFLQGTPEQWPKKPVTSPTEGDELRKPTFCGLTAIALIPDTPEASQFTTYGKLLEATTLSKHGAAEGNPSASDFKEAEISLLQRAQQDCFATDVAHLRSGKAVPCSSRLVTLAPEFDDTTQLIRVGGRLRHSTLLDQDAMHPIVLDPQHWITKLIIKEFDERLCHPGPERVFAEVRRKYWIIRGREAIRRHQRECTDCRKWRGTPQIPMMADLPPARLRLHKPAFYSTGVDCFGPYEVKIGRRSEKRWGILFKCMTTRAVYIDLLCSIDADSYLMALRRFVARRGKPFELLSDRGTNFRGGERELKEAFTALQPEVQAQLASQQIQFAFNPPSAPHFGGCWEREIRSLKQALRATLGAQSVTEEVLRTVLIEIEGILNSKPLGYTSSDIADPDPVTPNALLMGRRDASLPQVVYPESDLLSRRRWRHSQLLADHFWKHFLKYYLPGLQARQKWQAEVPDLQVGTTVMIVDPQLPRALWPVGRVSQVLPGPDDRVRTVEVQVGDRTYVRPVARIIRLPALPD